MKTQQLHQSRQVWKGAFRKDEPRRKLEKVTSERDTSQKDQNGFFWISKLDSLETTNCHFLNLQKARSRKKIFLSFIFDAKLKAKLRVKNQT